MTKHAFTFGLASRLFLEITGVMHVLAASGCRLAMASVSQPHEPRKYQSCRVKAG